jgi:DNA mismatch endonuclease (patch repair protein)
MLMKGKKKKKEGKRSQEELRHYTMSRIRSGDTGIETSFRKALWHDGIRYRKNYKKLPGTPDIAITKHKIAIFCDGEFWHGKDWAGRKNRIKSNPEFWLEKIERNIRRDRDTNKKLEAMGWTVLRFWGKDIKNDLPACVREVQDAIVQVGLQAWDMPGDGSL